VPAETCDDLARIVADASGQESSIEITCRFRVELVDAISEERLQALALTFIKQRDGVGIHGERAKVHAAYGAYLLAKGWAAASKDPVQSEPLARRYFWLSLSLQLEPTLGKEPLDSHDDQTACALLVLAQSELARIALLVEPTPATDGDG